MLRKNHKKLHSRRFPNNLTKNRMRNHLGVNKCKDMDVLH